MTPNGKTFPRFRAVADHAVLVEFGEAIGREIHDRVRHLDAILAIAPIEGFTEAVPAYVNLLVGFDPIVTDHASVERAIRQLIEQALPDTSKRAPREVLVCYDEALAPDLNAVAQATGLSREDVIQAHLSGRYGVFLYGFAPGYAYLAGVPKVIQVPRKSAPVRGVSAGSVLIAGPQCIVSTLLMPTGWWNIGRSPTRILRDDVERPFLFDIGDEVTFRRIDRDAFDAAEREA